jgi:tetrahydromethanopterin S-methyltransferase subunit G
MEQRVNKLEKQVERLGQAEKKLDFLARDSSVKIGIAEGLAEVTYRELTQIKIDMVQLRAEIHELRDSTDQNFESIHNRLDTQESMTKENSELLRAILAKLGERE